MPASASTKHEESRDSKTAAIVYSLTLMLILKSQQTDGGGTNEILLDLVSQVYTNKGYSAQPLYCRH
jgi:hypothetical protein